MMEFRLVAHEYLFPFNLLGCANIVYDLDLNLHCMPDVFDLRFSCEIEGISC